MLKNTSLFNYLVLMSCFFILNTALNAEEMSETYPSEWELGVGLGGVRLPHYRGSDQYADYIAPIPYVAYSGKRLKIDRDGGRFYFYKSKDVIVDVSTAFALNVNSSDNLARTGMTDLDNIVEIGPRVEFNLYESEDKNLRFRLGVPLRTGYAISLGQVKNIGLVFSPYLQLRYSSSGWESDVSLGPMWANESYHDYFYQVTPQYATATRAAYNATAGYSGSRLTLSVSKRFADMFFGLFARYDDLSGASFIDSPLVKQNDSLMLGVALSWVFKKSNHAGQN